MLVDAELAAVIGLPGSIHYNERSGASRIKTRCIKEAKMSDSPESVPEFSDDFWGLIDLARSDYDRYVETVHGMDREALMRFYWNYEDAAAEFKGDPYVKYMSPQLSEDGIDDVAQWIVAQGKDYYRNVVNHPEMVPYRVENPPEILGEVVHEFDERYDEPIPFPKDEAS
jgi:hypothetical protein